MILQRLVEYYDRRRAQRDDPIPPFGFSRERISFELVLERDGTKPELCDLRSPVESRAHGSRPVLAGRWMVVPYRGDRSSNIKSNFLWDNAGYVFGRTRSGADHKKQADFLKLHQQIASIVTNPELQAVLQFLRTWKPGNFANFPLASEALSEGNIVFRLRGEQHFVHDSPHLKTAWEDFFRGEIRQKEGFELITGTSTRLAEIHFLVQGVQDAQPTGASLSSFNASAYTSYGLQSSLNSPVSVDDVFKYVTTLRELLVYDRRRVVIGDATVSFWAEHRNELESFMSDLLGDTEFSSEPQTPEHRKRVQEIRLFLSQLKRGRCSNEAIDPEDSTKFYVLGLSAPGRARLSVRFWADSTVGEMKSRLAQHMEDVDLVGTREDDLPLTIKQTVLATGRAETGARGRLGRYDSRSISPLLAAAVARAVLTGGPYPEALLSAMIRRIRSDGLISHCRVAVIKGCIVRNSRLRGNPKEVSVALDRNRSEPAYVTGRLFALLEKIQQDSTQGTLNTTVKDRYFSAASATPGVVFPRLIRLSQYHLAKIDGGLKIHREKQLGEIVGKLDRFPAHFNLEEQGLFAVGYFHQHEDFFARKDTKAKEGEHA